MTRQRRRLVPPALRRGDTVAVVAPAFPPRDERHLKEGIRTLERWGLSVRPGKALGRRWGCFAGTDEERARDLQEAIDDPEVKGILFARGGWGTSRLFGRLDLSPLARRPKVLVGYSDLTVLFADLWRRWRLVCGYGPVVAELGRPAAFHAPSLRRALFRPAEPFSLRVARRSILARGRGEGPLVGGCVTLLAHLCGSGRLPDTRGAVILLEDVGEEPYRIDRMLWQLREAGFFSRAAGVLVGSMSDPAPADRKKDPAPVARSFTFREVLEDHLGPLGVPVLLDVPAGHVEGKWTLPLGLTARLGPAEGRVTFSP